MNQEKIHVTIASAILAVLFIATTPLVMASTIDIPDPALEKDPPSTNSSESIQVTIRPSDFDPANETQTISTEGANDVDFKGLPPAGTTVVIDNQSATVTADPVTIGSGTPAPSEPTVEEEPAPEEEEE